jgi:hypothetical protein
MNSLTLDNIPFRMDIGQLHRSLKMKEGSEFIGRLNLLTDHAQAIGRPKAHYEVVYIESRGEDHVMIDGVMLTSRVLRVNLEKAHRVFPFVATSGTELEEWSQSFDDLLEKYWVDAIKEFALRVAVEHLTERLVERFQPGKMARMNPGSLPDWPLTEQRPLFKLLGKGPEAVGVKLTESYLMIPVKSVSGIWFPTEENFESCQLCSREKCPGRRAPYDPNLYGRKYAKK